MKTLLRGVFVRASLTATLLSLLGYANLQAADFTRIDNATTLNLAGAWTTNGGPAAVNAPGFNDRVIWNSTFTLASTATNGFLAAGVNWGGIIIADPIVPIFITNNINNDRILTVGTNGIQMLGTQDLSIGATIRAGSNSTWRIGAGRTLTMVTGRETDMNNITVLEGPGTIFFDRPFDVQSNAVITITNDLVLRSTNTIDSPLVRVGQGTGGGTVNQVSGTVVLRRLATAAVMQMGNNAGSSVYNLSGGVLDTLGITSGGGFHALNVANNVGTGVLNVTNTGILRAGALNIGNNASTPSLGAIVNVSGNGVVEVRDLVVANNGLRFDPVGDPEADPPVLPVSHVGVLTISENGSLLVTNSFRVGANAGNVASARVDLNGGTLRVPSIVRGTGVTNNVSEANIFNFNGGTLSPLVTSFDFAPLNGSNQTVRLNVLAGGARIDTLGLDMTFLAPLLDGTGGGGLTKVGAGMLTLRGTNTYTGTTAVQAGAVVMANEANGGNSPISVSSGAAFGTLVRTPATSFGSSALTVAGGSILNFDASINGNPTAAVMSVGALSVSGSVTVNIAAAGLGLSVGQFTLITSAGAWTGGGSFVLGSLPQGVTAQLMVSGNDLVLDVQDVAIPVTWNGNVNGVWDINTTANWRDTATFSMAQNFKNGSQTTFDDNATGTTTITLDATAIPGGFDFVFSNSVPYSLSGNGTISGTVGLTKTNTGTVVMGLTNTYTGPTLINQGVFQLGSSNVIPDGVNIGALTLNGTLDLNGFNETVNGLTGTNSGVIDNTSGTPAMISVGNGASGTFAGVIQDTGGNLTFGKVGGGTITLQGANTYAGGTLMTGGALQVDPGSSLGNPAGPWSFSASTLFAGTDLDNTAPEFAIGIGGTVTLNISNAVTVDVAGLLVASNNAVLLKNGLGTLNLAQGGDIGAFRVDNGLATLASTVVLTNHINVNLGNVNTLKGTAILDGGTWVMLANDGLGADFNIANVAGSSGELHVTNNARLEMEDFFVAKVSSAALSSTGIVYQSSGVVTNTDPDNTEIRIAGNNNAAHTNTVGRYFLSGGRLDVIKVFNIGEDGNGRLEISGGEAHAWSGATHVGRRANSVGSLIVSGGMFIQETNNLNIGNIGAGTLTISGSGLVEVRNNSLQLGVATNSPFGGTVNLNGGTLRVRQVIDNVGVSTFNFNGGTLEALISTTDFMSDMTNAVVQAGGAFIDSGTNAITIPQNLTGSGALTKLGTGTLTLSGTNTYPGNSTVSAGTLVLATSFSGQSPVVVNDGATNGVRRTAANATAQVSSLNLAGGTVGLDVDLGSFGNSASPALSVNAPDTFTASGTVNVTVRGANLVPGTIPLVAYTFDEENGGPFAGFPSLQAGVLTLPRGVVATLSHTVGAGTGTINLVITQVHPLLWTGMTDNVWDINTTTNWAVTNLATVYLDNDAGLLFPDSGINKSINILSNVAPASITVSNSIGNDYTFGGLGLITGSGGITKTNTGTLFLSNSNNTYTGATLINQGVLKLGTNNVLPDSAAATNVTIGPAGTLDVNGFNDTIKGLDGSGVVENTGTSNSVLAIGAQNSSGSFSGVIQDTGSDLRLQKDGTGTNVLLSASTWGGGTFINTGVLAIGNNAALGVGTVNVDAAGTLATFGGARVVGNALISTNAGEANLDTTAGNLTLTGPVNWLNADFNKNGPNTLIFASSSVVVMGTDAEIAVNGGAIVIDGATITNVNDGLRTRATTNFPSVALTVQNNASVVFLSGANFNIGASGDTNVGPLALSNLFTLTSGTMTISNGGMFVANSVGNIATVNHDGGDITFSAAGNINGVSIAAATNTSGTYNLNGGSLTAGQIRKVGTNDAFARFVFGGGTLRALNNNNVGTNFMGAVDSVLVRAAGAFIDTAGFNMDIGQVLAEDASSTGGGLTKSGTGSLALNGVNTYTGPTVVNAGVLRGRGSVPTSVTGAGMIGGGDRDELGTFTINGNSTATGGASNRVSKTGMTLTADKVSVTGTLNLSGTLVVTASGDALAAGDTFDLFDAAVFAGSFTAFDLPALPPGLTWDARNANVNGTITVVTLTVVEDISVNAAGDMVTLGGTGGEPNAAYRILSTDDLTQPMETWTQVGTGMFDGSGNFNLTFAVTPTDERRFYVVVYP